MLYMSYMGNKVGIKKEDIISIETTMLFYYKGCEVSLKKSNQIYEIKVTGVSDFGNIIVASRVFRKKVDRESVIDYLNGEMKNIERVYNSVLDKEFGMDDKISIK